MYKFMLCSRYLTTRYIGMVSVASVMIGVTTLIVVNSVMGGFRAKMRERLKGVLSDVVVESTTMDGFPNPKIVLDRVRDVVGDKIVAMTPTVETFAILTFEINGQNLTRTVRVIGIDPKGRAEVGDYREHLVNPENRQAPSFDLRADAQDYRARHILPEPELEAGGEANDWQGAVVGFQIANVRAQGMKDDISIIKPGQEVIVTTVKAGTPPRPIDDKFIVVDYFKCDMSEYDSNYVFVPIERLQRVKQMGDAVTSIQLKLKDYADAPYVVDALRRTLHPSYFMVHTWEDKQGPLLRAVKVEAWILNFILFFIIAVAGFGILAIFFMIVVEKTRDIGILKALGASDSGVMSVFLGYGLALGVVGCILGAGAGVLITLYINPIEKSIAACTGWELFPRDIYYFKDIPAKLEPMTVLFVNLGALAIAVAASVLPARRAARLRPVEALRYE